ncbi:MAG: SLBB domain-containing protein [Planctomycetia bacterium]
MKYVAYETSGLAIKKIAIRILVLALLPLIFSGCAKNQYHVRNLPAQYVAQPVPDLDKLDLSSFATQSTSQDTIAWGDELRVHVHAGYEENPPDPVTVRVARDGTIAIPSVGRVYVAGLEIEAAENAIGMESRRRQVYPNPFVSVQFSKRRMNQVTVTGAVKKPGTYPLLRGESSLMAAIIAAGGLSKDANENVQIKRADPLANRSNVQPVSVMIDPKTGQVIPVTPPQDSGVVQVNLLLPFRGGVPGKYELNEGDVVTVPRRELPAVHVLGLVKKPGAVELTGDADLHLLDAISAAGGVKTHVADRVLVLRHGEEANQEPVRILASIQKALDGDENLRLAPGDTVIVRNTPATVIDEVLRTFVRMSIGSSIALW